MSSDFQDLREYRWGCDEALFSLGFAQWEEHSTESTRQMGYHLLLASKWEPPWGFYDPTEQEYELRLWVRYSVDIADAPFAPTDMNFSYHLIGAFVEVWESSDVPESDGDNANGDGKARFQFETSIQTVSQLRSFLDAFPGK